MNLQMNKKVFIGVIYALTLIVMLIPTLGKAAVRGKTVPSSIRNGHTKLSTSMAFSGSRVGGQYQVPSEATARIENEKPIEELLGLRTQFRDRMKQDEERN